MGDQFAPGNSIKKIRLMMGLRQRLGDLVFSGPSTTPQDLRLLRDELVVREYAALVEAREALELAGDIHRRAARK